MRKLIAIAFIVAISSESGAALACTCTELTLEGRIDLSDYVFRAYVTGAQVETNWLGHSTGRVGITFTEVIPYKGGVPPFDGLWTPQARSACGARVYVPENYWFFVGKDGRLSKCSGSGVARHEDFRRLNEEASDQLMQVIRERD